MHIKYGSALLLMVIPSAVLAEQYFKNSKYPIDLQPTNHWLDFKNACVSTE